MIAETIKVVKPSGNAGSIYVPRGWIGERVVAKLLSPEERIMDFLRPHSRHIIGIYLYGSYSRGEEEADSHLDFLVLSDRNLRLKPPTYLNLSLFTPTTIREAMEESPLDIYPILLEAVPVFNEALLQELVERPMERKILQETLQEAETWFGTEIAKLGEKTEPPTLISPLFDRLRSVYTISCILAQATYTNAKFKRFFVEQEVDTACFENLYQLHRAIRDGRRPPVVAADAPTVSRLLEIGLTEARRLKGLI